MLHRLKGTIMNNKKLNRGEIIAFAKGLKECCRGMAKNGKKTFSREICIPEGEKRYKMTISEIEED